VSQVLSVLARVISLYLKRKLASSMSLVELQRWKRTIDVEQERVRSGSDADKCAAQTALLAHVIKACGPFVQKSMQMMRSKDATTWLNAAILEVRSSLPPIPNDSVAAMLKAALVSEGLTDIAARFDDHFRLCEVLGTASLGHVVRAQFRGPGDDAWTDVAIKVLKPNVLRALHEDKAIFDACFDELAASGAITRTQASAFAKYNARQAAGVLAEADIAAENTNLRAVRDTYDGPHVRMVKPTAHPLLSRVLLSTAVCMEVVPGVDLGKRLRALGSILAQLDAEAAASDAVGDGTGPWLADGVPVVDREHVARDAAARELRRDAVLREMAAMRRSWVEFARMSVENVLQNDVTHIDPHTGNFKWTYDADAGSGMLYVLDMGAAIRPAKTPTDLLELKLFISHLNLALGTGDVTLLRLFYEEFARLTSGTHAVPPHLVDEVVRRVRPVLAATRTAADNSVRVDVDDVTREVVKEIVGVVLSSTDDTSHVLPPALMALSRANILVAEELTGLMNNLRGSKYETDIPYLERSQFGIAVQTAVFGGVADVEGRTGGVFGFFRRLMLLLPRTHDFWTPAAWAHMETVMQSREQAVFCAKYVSGTLGLQPWEARLLTLGAHGAALGIRGIVFGKSLLPEWMTAFHPPHLVNGLPAPTPLSSVDATFEGTAAAAVPATVPVPTAPPQHAASAVDSDLECSDDDGDGDGGVRPPLGLCVCAGLLAASAVVSAPTTRRGSSAPSSHGSHHDAGSPRYSGSRASSSSASSPVCDLARHDAACVALRRRVCSSTATRVVAPRLPLRALAAATTLQRGARRLVTVASAGRHATAGVCVMTLAGVAHHP
jgi:hypothetical protein